MASDELTVRIGSIWERGLGVPVGGDTDFFDAGGDSLAGMRIIAAVDEAAGTRLRLRVLFDNSRFDDFVAAVRQEIELSARA